VEAFCQSYAIWPAFESSELYHLTAEYYSDNIIPFAGHPGCYFFYAEDGTLLYIGQTTVNLGGRVCRYFKMRLEFSPVHSQWTARPRYLMTTRVNEPDQAPKLEKDLIDKFRPPDNGRVYRLADPGKNLAPMTARRAQTRGNARASYSCARRGSSRA
jgi:hypothetical protein